jgi:hypothetical protein
LVRVTESGVGDEQALLLARPFGEFFRPELEQQLARAVGRGLLFIAIRRVGQEQRCFWDVTFGGRISVYDDVGKEIHQLGRAIAAWLEFEKLWRVVEQRCRRLPGTERRIEDDVLQKWNVRLHAANTELAQGAVHALECDVEVRAVGSDLDQEGIVERGDDCAVVAHAAVETNAETTRGTVGQNLAVVGREFVFGVFGRDAALDGATLARNLALLRQVNLRPVQCVALRDQNLRADEVETGDDFSDGMLDLDARVDLDEIPVVGVEVVKEFDGAGVVVFDFAGHVDGGFAQFAADAFVEPDGGRDLDNFLVAALHGAIALVQMQDVPMAVPEDLDFDVFGARDVFFQEHRWIAESATRFALGFVEEVGEISGFMHDAHAATAAAEGSFDDERKSNFVCDLQSLSAIGHRLFCSRQRRDVYPFRQRTGGSFVAHQFEKVGARPNKFNSGRATRPGEFGIFSEEAVARMDHVDVVFLGQGNDAWDIKVRADRALALADEIGFVSFEAMDAESIFLRVNGDGAQAQFGGGAENADRNLTAIGDEQFFGSTRRCAGSSGGGGLG